MYKGYEITLCIPTLTRYDLLSKCINSAENSIVKPDKYLIINNGNNLINIPDDKVEVISFGHNIGVAASWNYFIKHTNEIRIISNDDVEFYPDTIKEFVDGYKDNYINYCAGINGLNSFSLFIIPDKIINAVGLFDETISPNYAYYEDNDYHYRMKLLGYDIYGNTNWNAGHIGSATLKAFTQEQMDQHHSKFRIATANYQRKWGGLPGHETYKTPYCL